MTLLEVCVDDATGLAAAVTGGADRIELCSALELGGLTPSAGLIAQAARSPVPVRAMVRPRPGDFVFDADLVETMRGEIVAIRQAGLAGVVLGASLPDGRLDMATLRMLVDVAGDLPKTLHRAFDLVPDLAEAIEQAIELGFDTVLTSGRAVNALAGIDDIIEAHGLAAGRIAIMAGAGLDAANVHTILDRVTLPAVHGSCSAPAAPASSPATRLGFASAGRRATSSGKVAALKAALSSGRSSAS